MEQTMASIGRIGGLATLERYGREHFARISRRGVATNRARYGREHYQRIGAIGGAIAAGRPTAWWQEQGRKGGLKRAANAKRRKEEGERGNSRD